MNRTDHFFQIPIGKDIVMTKKARNFIFGHITFTELDEGIYEVFPTKRFVDGEYRKLKLNRGYWEKYTNPSTYLLVHYE